MEGGSGEGGREGEEGAVRDGRVCAGERRGGGGKGAVRYRYYLVWHVNTTTGSVPSNSNGFPYHPNPEQATLS